MQARAALGAATILSRRLSTETRPSSLRARLLTPRARHPPGNNNRIARATMSSGDPSLCGDVFFLDEFAMRQWDDPKYGGTRIDFDKAEFVRRVHEAHAAGALLDGYAPFCKHVRPQLRPRHEGGAPSPSPLKTNISSAAATPVADRTPNSPSSRGGSPRIRWTFPTPPTSDVIPLPREQLVKERFAMAAKEERPPSRTRRGESSCRQGPTRGFRVSHDAHNHDAQHDDRGGGQRRRHRSSRVRESVEYSLQTRAHRRRRSAERRVSASIVVRGSECRLLSRRIAGVTSSRARDGSDGTRHV